VFNTQPTATYTDYHTDVTSLTFTMNDGAVFSYPGSGSALSAFEFRTISPYMTLPSERVAHRRTGFGLSSGCGCTFAVTLRGRVVERVLVARTVLG
jgi:hypothetical protein